MKFANGRQNIVKIPVIPSLNFPPGSQTLFYLSDIVRLNLWSSVASGLQRRGNMAQHQGTVLSSEIRVSGSVKYSRVINIITVKSRPNLVKEHTIAVVSFTVAGTTLL